MPVNFRLFVTISIACFVMTGCSTSPKSFLDPSFPKVAYDDVKKRNEPLKLKLLVEFQRNGQPFPQVDNILKEYAEPVLRRSGVVVPVMSQEEGEIKVVLNNIADGKLGAFAKGFGTGLTFGLVGTTVTDAYEMSLTITVKGKTVTRTAIRHAIHTAIGNTSTPAWLETTPMEIAFGRIVEQMLLRSLQDIQKNGELSWQEGHKLHCCWTHKELSNQYKGYSRS